MGQDQDETRNLCLRVKGCFIGSKIMNRFGWSVVALLSLVIFLFTGLSLSLPWWAIDYSMNCGGYYKVLMLRNGMCTASSSQHPESNPNKCIAWYSEDSWAEVDATAGTDTEHDASYTYPLCLILEYTAIATALLQTLISFYQWKNIVKDLVLQRIVLLLSIICISLQLAISTIGAKTDVTDENTWKYTNDCSDSTSYPGLGYYFQGATFYMAWIVVFIANFPEKCCCVHLTRSDQDFGTAEPPVLNALTGIFVTENISGRSPSASSIHYSDPESRSPSLIAAILRTSSTEMTSKPP